MRKRWSITAGLVLVATLLGAVGCVSSTPSESNFNLIFKYGVGARNELNTFNGTYTRDMVLDPSITVNLSLTKEELDRIYQKMVEIGFFNYSDKFAISVAPGEVIGMLTPYSSYYFKVERDSNIKELRWEDDIANEDKKAKKLRELIKLITDIIESKEEYKKLPSPSSGYM